MLNADFGSALILVRYSSECEPNLLFTNSLAMRRGTHKASSCVKELPGMGTRIGFEKIAEWE